ncbi:MAG TPA: hypothetical protein VNX70_13625 [Bryobacteraceae bacterium]|jgi:hypothetical protein|nr:hypothetical protein [Bryobacteraceae bacterium]
MINPISNVTPPPTVAPATKESTQKPASKPATGKDVVKLSSTAQAIAAALQETRETSVQTAKEAQGGDLQAGRLLAKEAAAAKLAGK